jgi:hypothetical protein
MAFPLSHLLYDEILLAQEAVEDQRLQAQSREIWQASQEYSCPEDNETTPWLKHTKWPDLFQNRPLDIITASAQQPRLSLDEDYLLGHWRGTPLRSPAINEAKLRILMKAVDQMFERAIATLACTNYRLRCWLGTYRKDSFRSCAFHLVSSQKRYISSWKQFICYIFRVLACKPLYRKQIYNLQFRPKEIQMMNYILSLLEEEDIVFEKEKKEDDEEEDDEEDDDEEDDDEEDDDEEDDEENDDEEDYDDEGEEDEEESNFTLPSGSDLELSEALFQLSMMFWTHQDSAGDMTSSVLVHFIAVLGVHRHSLAYKTAYNSTPELSRFVWIGRLLFLEYALPLHAYTTLALPWPARDTYQSQIDRFEVIRTKYLLRGSLCPLGELIELRAFAKSIIKKEGGLSNLSWAPDGQSFTIGDNKKIRLLDFCTIHHRALTQVTEQVNKMMLGWDQTVDLAAIRDDLTCRTPGWSFLNHEENNLTFKYKALSRRAWASSFADKPFTKAGHWLSEACTAYLKAGTELASNIFAAFHLTASLPGRGTEIGSIRLLNTKLAIRHIFVREGRILIIISYNKSRASNNHAFYIVRYLPPGLDLSVFKYLVYIRPFLNFLANQLNVLQYQSTEFFFPDSNHKKKHLSSTQASNILKRLTQDLVTPWTLSLYRQAALTIAKRYISELIKKINFYNPLNASSPIRMIAASAGHHPRTLLGAYAVDKALPSRLQPELLEMYLRLSTLWQDWNQQYYQDHHPNLVSDPTASYPSPPALSPLAGSKRPASPSSSGRSKKKICNPSSTESATSDGFLYNTEYKILICVACESIIQPEPIACYRHLNNIHRITGPPCKTLLERFATYDLCPFKELSVPQEKIAPIPGLKVQESFQCNICPSPLGPSYFTIHKPHIDTHLAKHKLGIRPKNAWETGKYSKCLVQTFSLAKGRIQYFEVDRGV